MVDNKQTKFGFSLAEALVSMLVMSIFFVVTAKVMTTKPKQETLKISHGYFECYIDGGKLYQKLHSESSPKEASSDTCAFNPPDSVTSVNIYILAKDGSEVKYFSSVEPIFDGNSEGSAEGNDPNIAKIKKSDVENYKDAFPALSSSSSIDELKNFLSQSYDSSEIYKKISDSSTYEGPALLIGW